MSAHHDHDHSHPTHCHTHAAPSSNFAFLFSIFLNGGFVIVQLIYAYLAHSSSLLADAGHNFSDVLALGFSWMTLLLAQRKSTSTHSYGYKKSTVLATLSNAALLVAASAIIIFESLDHLFHPAAVLPLPIIVVALMGIVINGGSALLFLKQSKTDLNIKSAYLHLVYDMLTSLSVVIAGALIYFTHWNAFDPLCALAIGLFILKNSLQLLKKTIDLSLDGVPKEIDFTTVQNYLSHLNGVTAVHDLHIWALSTTENALTVHLVRPSGNFNTEERRVLSHDLIHQFHIGHSTIQIEELEIKDCLHEQNC